MSSVAGRASSSRWTTASVARSTLAVASSHTSTRPGGAPGHWTRDRARQRSCRSPTLKFWPPAATGVSSPSGSARKVGSSPQRVRA